MVYTSSRVYFHIKKSIFHFIYSVLNCTGLGLNICEAQGLEVRIPRHREQSTTDGGLIIIKQRVSFDYCAREGVWLDVSRWISVNGDD
jgi:hypothetical protein